MNLIKMMVEQAIQAHLANLLVKLVDAILALQILGLEV
jgi:hypothetical protein